MFLWYNLANHKHNMNCFVVICALLLGQAFILAKPISVFQTEVKFRSHKLTVRSIVIGFEAFAEGGLRVTILNAAGLGHLSFNAKINQPIGKRRKGQLVWDISNTTENEIVTNFPDRLLVGDAINYWIRIRYNNSTLNSKSLTYIVPDLTPGPINILPRQDIPIPSSTMKTFYSNRRPTTPSRKPQDTPDCTCSKDILTDVWAKMNSTADKVLILEETISPLKDKIRILAETIDELIYIENVGTSLLLTGNLPAQTNAVEDVRHLLIEKLNLIDISNNIIQAKYDDCGEISFEVRSPIDKLRILKRSREILSKLPYRIEDPNGREKTEAGQMCTDSFKIDVRFSDDEPKSGAIKMPPTPSHVSTRNAKATVKIQRGVDAA